MAEIIQFRHIFVDHSNIWGGARLATKLKRPDIPDWEARISVKKLDRILGGGLRGVSTKIVSGGIPPGMETVWAEYQGAGYNAQRLFRDENWKERGVDHTIIGHMWRLLAQNRDHPVTLVLASGDGRVNEFGTSFYEVLTEVLNTKHYPNWRLELVSFDWPMPNPEKVNSPLGRKVRQLVEGSDRAKLVNLIDNYGSVVYFEHRD
jgi:hypothetical protein